MSDDDEIEVAGLSGMLAWKKYNGKYVKTGENEWTNKKRKAVKLQKNIHFGQPIWKFSAHQECQHRFLFNEHNHSMPWEVPQNSWKSYADPCLDYGALAYKMRVCKGSCEEIEHTDVKNIFKARTAQVRADDHVLPNCGSVRGWF